MGMRLAYLLLVLAAVLIITTGLAEPTGSLAPYTATFYTYRVPVTIDNTANSNTLSNYAVSFVIDTSALMRAGKMRGDCGDIRVYDSDGSTQLPYWVETGCGTTSTRIWVKVPSIPGGAKKTIYLTYGNLSLTSQSNPKSVFLFYSDGSDYSAWTQGTYACSQDTGNGDPAPSFKCPSGSGYYMFVNAGVQAGVLITFNTETTLLGDFFFAVNSTGAGQMYRIDSRSNWYSGFATTSSWTSWGGPSSGFTASANTWYRFAIVINSSTTATLYYLQSASPTPSLQGMTKLGSYTIAVKGPYIGLVGDQGGTSYYTWWDNIIVRPIANPEPTVTVGSEQAVPYTVGGYQAYVVYQVFKEDFSDGQWNFFVVSSSASGAGSWSSAASSGAWQVKASASSPSSGTATETVWFNFTPVWSVSLTLSVSSILGSGVYVDVYVNNVKVTSLSSTDGAVINPASTTLLARGGTVSVRIYAYAYSGYGATATGSTTIDDVVAVTAMQAAAPVTYVAYPDRTDYTIILTHSCYTIINATVKIPGDFSITSSTPAYTGRNSTHVWWYNANTQTITLKASSTTKVYPSFTWRPVYNLSLANATYIRLGQNITVYPRPTRFYVKNSTGYYLLGNLSLATPGEYSLAPLWENGTHASMLLSPTVHVVTYELAWRVDSNANTIYVTQMRYRWPTSYGYSYYYPNFTVVVKPQYLIATGSNGYAELPFSESQFQPGSVTMYVYDQYGIVDKPVTIPVRNLTIVNYEVYGTNVYDVHFVVNLTYHDGSLFTGRLYFSSNALRCPQYLDFNSTVRSWDVIITPYGGGANYINISSVYVADSDCIALKNHVTKYWLKFIVALTFDEIQLKDAYERGDILSGGFYVRNTGNFTLKDLKMRLRFRYEKNGYYYFDRMYNLTFGYYGTELPPQAGASILLDEANVKLLLLEGNYTMRVTFYSGDTIVLAELVLPFYVGKFYTLAFVCVNQNNQPLAGIKVVAIDINRMKAYSAVTGAEGMAQLKLPSGSYIAYADEHTIETYTTLTLDGDKVLRWTLVTPMAQQTIVVQQPYSITEGITWVVLLAVSGAILYAALKGRQGGGR